jgi:hypothetical protein
VASLSLSARHFSSEWLATSLKKCALERATECTGRAEQERRSVLPCFSLREEGGPLMNVSGRHRRHELQIRESQSTQVLARLGLWGPRIFEVEFESEISYREWFAVR